MKHPLRLLIIAIVIVLLFIVVSFSKKQPNGDTASNFNFGIISTEGAGVSIGKMAPDFLLPDFDGNMVKLSDFRGRPIILDFWASWCPFCLRELPEIESAHKANPDVVFLGIHRSATESISTGQEFAAEKGVTYTLLRDDSDEVYTTYTAGGSFMPVAIFIDSEGVISDIIFGPKTLKQLEESITKLNSPNN